MNGCWTDELLRDEKIKPSPHQITSPPVRPALVLVTNISLLPLLEATLAKDVSVSVWDRPTFDRPTTLQRLSTECLITCTEFVWKTEDFPWAKFSCIISYDVMLKDSPSAYLKSLIDSQQISVYSVQADRTKLAEAIDRAIGTTLPQLPADISVICSQAAVPISTHCAVAFHLLLSDSSL